MLNMACALAAEAKPIIAKFKLKNVKDRGPYPIYSGDTISLVVSGVGKLSASSAVGYLQGVQGNPSYTAWLNIGIGGHSYLNVGHGILGNQILDQSSGRCSYPGFTMDLNCKTRPIITVDQPETEYAEDFVYDMEATGFFAAASRFTTVELIHSYKVISDNKENPTETVSPKLVEGLIESNIDEISEITQSLLKLSLQLEELHKPFSELRNFLKRWHFTETQVFQLKNLLRRWRACKTKETLWDTKLKSFKKSYDALHYLEQKINKLPLDVSSNLL